MFQQNASEKMPKTPAKNATKSKENSVNTALLGNRALVQRFLIDHSGYSFTVSELREKISAWAFTMLHRKTIISALREIEALGIGLQCEVRRAGRRCIPVKFYTIKK